MVDAPAVQVSRAARRSGPAMPEFVALMAMLVAMVAFSIDAMLPAIPAIGAALSPEAPAAATLVVGAFIFGLGGGMFFAGPLSDRFGRKPVILAFLAVYLCGTLLAALAPSIELLLLGRLVQGVGASGPRIIALALVRDRFAGVRMAQVMSFVMMVFTLAPALAPMMGAAILEFSGWRTIFVGLMLFALTVGAWLALRQPETLPPEGRRTLGLGDLHKGLREIAGSRQAVLGTAIQTLLFATLVSLIASVQPIFERSFGRGASFHFWFGGMALGAAAASALNAVIVERFGMMRVIRATLIAVIALTVATAGASGLAPHVAFAAFVVWATSIFALAGLTIGNINAIAMEPMGRIAGLAASIIGGLSTIGAVVIAAPIGLLSDGGTVPLFIGVILCLLGAFALTGRVAEARAPA